VIDYRTLRVWQCIAEYAVAHNTSVSLTAVCASCVDRTAMSGAWVAWGNPPLERVHATDPVAERVADLHVLLGQGPAVDAWREACPVAVADLRSAASQQAWPVFAAHAQSAGIRAVVAVPLRAGTAAIGLFGMYSRSTVVLEDEQHLEVAVFAEVALGLLLDTHHAPPADVARWLSVEAEVHQATGIVSVQLGIGVEESLVRLRAHAFAEGKPLLEIAREVVARRLRFHHPPRQNQPDQQPDG
jgi:hypothetical protein